MPLTEVTIYGLIPQTEYYVETNIGNLIDKFKATFSHIEGRCAIFIKTFKVTSTGFIELIVNTRLRIFPYIDHDGWQKIFYKISDHIRYKVETQNEYVYEAAFQKVMRDTFCPKTHYNEEGNPIYYGKGKLLNYTDIFVDMFTSTNL